MAARHVASPHRYGNSHAIWDNTESEVSGRADIPALTPAKLVLDLATPEGCKAELWLSVTQNSLFLP